MAGDKIKALPWTSHLLTPDEFKAWVANRMDAGRNIDINRSRCISCDTPKSRRRANPDRDAPRLDRPQ
jgi:hypothetical protein